jgi:hypothetical protein
MKKPSSQSLTTSSAAAIGLAIAACSVFFLLYAAPLQTEVFTELQLLSMQLGSVEQRNHDRMVQLGAAERRTHGMLMHLDQRLTDIRTALNVLAEAMDVTPMDMTLKKGSSETVFKAQAEDDADLSSESKVVGSEEGGSLSE